MTESATKAVKLERARADLVELRHSYYLHGAKKKLDIREVPRFRQVARRTIEDHRTNMDYDRLYTLWQAIRGAPRKYPMVEIGVYRGGSARFIADTLRASRRRPRLYLCDTFAGHPRTDPELDPVHHNAHKFEDASVEKTAGYVADYQNVRMVVGDIVETSEQLAKQQFAFVHVDVDVYPATDFCLRFFMPRLADGAVLVIDDYGFLTCPGAKRAADDFIEEHPEYRLFHLLTGQAIIYQSRAN